VIQTGGHGKGVKEGVKIRIGKKKQEGKKKKRKSAVAGEKGSRIYNRREVED